MQDRLHQYAENLSTILLVTSPKVRQSTFSHIKEVGRSHKIHIEAAWVLHMDVCIHIQTSALSNRSWLLPLLENGRGKSLCILKGQQTSLQLAEQVFWNGLARTHTLVLSTTEESQLPLRPKTKTASLGLSGRKMWRFLSLWGFLRPYSPFSTPLQKQNSSQH